MLHIKIPIHLDRDSFFLWVEIRFRYKGKKVSHNDSPFLSTELFGFDCTCGAVAYASTAVDTFSSVDNINTTVFFDATCRAAACASATTDAFGTDFMSHWKYTSFFILQAYFISEPVFLQGVFLIFIKKRIKSRKKLYFYTNYKEFT